MANSRYEYVKQYELDDKLLPGCWIVIRIDGKGFTKFSKEHYFEKPNDERALHLMNSCAQEVLRTFPDIRLAFGESDEYSFAFQPGTSLYGRRSSKLVSLVVSCFSANYVRLWPLHFFQQDLLSTPIFDGRAICYPSDRILRDYLSWRQADTHINNQYNTCFWELVKSGLGAEEAQSQLKGTQSDSKNELLYARFGINYNSLPEMFRKGSTIIRMRQRVHAKVKEDGTPVIRESQQPVVLHEDIIGSAFWDRHPELLA